MELKKISCRTRLSAKDLEFAEAVLGFEEEGASIMWNNPQERDAVLDKEALFQALINDQTILPISQYFYFYVLIRRALLDKDIDNRDVADYIGSMLVHRSQTAQAFPEKVTGGAIHWYVSDVVKMLQEAQGAQRFYLGVEVANMTLFLTGVFEEHFTFRQDRRGAPGISFYEDLGQTQYFEVAKHRLADEHDISDVFKHLGTYFKETKQALSLMSDRLTFLGDNYPYVEGF